MHQLELELEWGISSIVFLSHERRIGRDRTECPPSRDRIRSGPGRWSCDEALALSLWKRQDVVCLYCYKHTHAHIFLVSVRFILFRACVWCVSLWECVSDTTGIFIMSCAHPSLGLLPSPVHEWLSCSVRQRHSALRSHILNRHRRRHR